MKFFSNDAAKENTDNDRDRSDVVTSDPVPVPQQRAGSPWTKAPGSTDDERAEDAGRTDTADQPTDRGGYHHDSIETDVETDSTDRPNDRGGYHNDSTETDTDTDRGGYHPDGTGTTAEGDTPRPYGEDGILVTPDRTADSTTADDAVKDEGTFDSPRAVEPATGEPLTDTTVEPAADSTSAKPAVDAEPSVDAEPEPVTAVDTTPTDDSTDKPVDGAPVDTPVVAAVPIETAPAATPASQARLLADGDALADRFRDIQLRFVDGPKEAAAEAAALVAEAVDQLTSRLQEQKTSLASNSDDTEQLRVELRGYRDLLNRLLAL